MITYKICTLKSHFLQSVTDLYESAFPENERIPLINLFNDHTEVLAFFEDEKYIGFASIVSAVGLSHITFFALLPEKRGQGIGSQLIRLMVEYKKPNKIILDCENEDVPCDNREERIRRKNFYYKNGFRQSEVFYKWQGEYYNILVSDGSLSFEEFDNFWLAFGFDTRNLH